MAEKPFSEVSFSDRNLMVVNILASCKFIIARHKRVKIQWNSLRMMN